MRTEQTPTNNIDVGVGDDGAVLVGGVALVDRSFSEVDIMQDERSTGCQGKFGVHIHHF